MATRHIQLIGFLVAACALPGIASAALIAADDFTNPEGNATLVGDTGGIGFSGGWAGTGITAANSGSINSVAAGGITTPSNYAFARTGGEGQIVTVANGTGATVTSTRPLNTAINLDADGTHYFSILFRRIDSTNSGTENVTFLDGRNSGGTRLFGFGSNSSEQPSAVIGTTTSGATTDTYSIGSSYLVVGKIVAKATGNDEIYMSLFENSETLPAVEGSWEYTAAGAAAGSVTTLGTTVPLNASQLLIDNLRYGSTFEDVVAVPEPAALGVIAGGLAMALRRRRR